MIFEGWRWISDNIKHPGGKYQRPCQRVNAVLHAETKLDQRQAQCDPIASSYSPKYVMDRSISCKKKGISSQYSTSVTHTINVGSLKKELYVYCMNSCKRILKPSNTTQLEDSLFVYRTGCRHKNAINPLREAVILANISTY